MKIPTEEAARSSFLQRVIERCMASQEERKAAYRTLKSYYLHGAESTNSDTENVYGIINKIYPHIDQVQSFLYSGDTTRFSVEVGRSVAELEQHKIPALNGAMNDLWHSSNTDVRYGQALKWSLVYGSMFIKARQHHGRVIPDIVLPHHIGVWREDLMGFEEQEAIVHEYRIPKSQLLHDLVLANKKDAQQIVDAAIESFGDLDDQSAQPIDRIITSSAYPNVQGEVNTAIGARVNYIAKIAVPMVKMYEAYVFDDDLKDYRVFTLAAPYVHVFDRPMESMYVEKEQPLVQVCPFPIHDYFFGVAAVERLITLQALRNTRFDQVQHMMEMQARPPGYAAGFEGDAGEIQDTMDTAGGLVVSSMPSAKVDKMPPTIPEDLFGSIDYIDSQFDDQLGVNPVMSGKGESGVRSEGHAAQLLRAGASRAKNTALVIEDSIEELATLYLKLLKKYSKDKYRADDGEQFIPAQFTDQFMVKVDAHSSSPIFMQDQTQLAFMLFKARAIDREELIDMLPIGMKDLLKLKLKTKIEPAEAAAQKAQLAAEAQGKVTHIGGKK